MKEMFVEELMVLSSIQLFMANPDYIRPEAFGTGCIVKYREEFYLLSVFHVIKHDDLNMFLETNMEPDKNSVPVIPVGNFMFFDLLKIHKHANSEELLKLIDEGGERLDITFAKLENLPPLLQPEIDFGFMKIEKGSKVYLNLDCIVEPTREEVYGFFGKINHTYNGLYLSMQPTIKNDLKYQSSNKLFHKFLAPEIIKSKSDYEGCSGAPILDSEGRLVALACKVVEGTKLIYGFSIQECIKLLNIAIETKQV